MIEDTLVLGELNSFLEDFIKLDPKRQRWLMTAIARKADSLNRKRVTRQVNLDESKYKGRKREAKKKMFLKLKQRKNMYIQVQGNQAVIGYKGIMGKTAYEHQHGVMIKKDFVQRSVTIGTGRRHRAKGSDPCTKAQAGILYSFVITGDEGLEPEPRVTLEQIRKAEPVKGQTRGRGIRNAIIGMFQDAYTAAEAGHAIARWDMQITRKHGSRSPYYRLPKRDLLGVSSRDLPELLNYAEERLNHYLKQ